MKKQYTVDYAYTGNVEVKKYIGGKCIGSTIINDYDLSGYEISLSEDGYERAEDVDKAKAIMEKAKEEYEEAVEWYEYAKKIALVKENEQ